VAEKRGTNGIYQKNVAEKRGTNGIYQKTVAEKRGTNGNYQKTVAEKSGKWQSEANSDAGTANRHCRHIRSSVRRKGKRWSELCDRNRFQFVHDDDELQ
jgi:nitrogen fixation protein FixH